VEKAEESAIGKILGAPREGVGKARGREGGREGEG